MEGWKLGCFLISLVLTQEIDWTQEDAEVPTDNTHLWEESWDDDDTSEDFSAQLKSVLFTSTLEMLGNFGLDVWLTD